MLKIGVIWIGRQCEEYLGRSLGAWMSAAVSKTGGHEYKIVCASAPFEGFDNSEAEDTTRLQLKELLDKKRIDDLIWLDIPIKETRLRTMALQKLKELDVDVVVIADADEFPTNKQIEDVFNFVENNPYILWFSLCYRNFIFDTNTYLKEPFCPPRIFRIKIGGMHAEGFYEDNNIYYAGNITKNIKYDKEFASFVIPKETAWITHYSWLNSDRSRRKCEYQLARGWEPSFKWNYQKNELEFNLDFYLKRGLPLPELNYLESN